MSKRRNHTDRRPQSPKARTPQAVQRTQDLRRSNAATPIPSGKVYNRHDRSWRNEW